MIALFVLFVCDESDHIFTCCERTWQTFWCIVASSFNVIIHSLVHTVIDCSHFCWLNYTADIFSVLCISLFCPTDGKIVHSWCLMDVLPTVTWLEEQCNFDVFVFFSDSFSASLCCVANWRGSLLSKYCSSLLVTDNNATLPVWLFNCWERLLLLTHCFICCCSLTAVLVLYFVCSFLFCVMCLSF